MTTETKPEEGVNVNVTILPAHNTVILTPPVDAIVLPGFWSEGMWNVWTLRSSGLGPSVDFLTVEDEHVMEWREIE